MVMKFCGKELMVDSKWCSNMSNKNLVCVRAYGEVR